MTMIYINVFIKLMFQNKTKLGVVFLQKKMKTKNTKLFRGANFSHSTLSASKLNTNTNNNIKP